jgi:transposase
MAKLLVSDELWTLIEPLLPPERPKPKCGRPLIPNRAALSGIIFALKSGISWEMLPQEMGCGSGMTPGFAGAGLYGVFDVKPHFVGLGYSGGVDPRGARLGARERATHLYSAGPAGTSTMMQ